MGRHFNQPHKFSYRNRVTQTESRMSTEQLTLVTRPSNPMATLPVEIVDAYTNHQSR